MFCLRKKPSLFKMVYRQLTWLTGTQLWPPRLYLEAMCRIQPMVRYNSICVTVIRSKLVGIQLRAILLRLSLLFYKTSVHLITACDQEWAPMSISMGIRLHDKED